MYRALLLLILAPAISRAQIPAGTILPVQLGSSIDSHKTQAGDRISTRLMQSVDLGNGRRLNAGTRLTGTIKAVGPESVTFEINEVKFHRRISPVLTDLRAIASTMEVHDAELPTNSAGGDRGSSMADWNTIQVGGEAVYGRGGPVMKGTLVVGHSLMSGGVLAVPRANPDDSKCRADLSHGVPQSFWIFATSACGVYGYEGMTIEHAGRSRPMGTITIRSSTPIRLRSGTALLLRVIV
jgi:hypothetical protein